MAFINRTVSRENVIIDLDAKETAAKIVRGGVEVTAPKTRPEAVVGLLDALGRFTTFEEPRVMRQEPAPGTLVAPGTVISLTLIPPSDTPFNVFTGVHTGLLQRDVASLVNILTQNQAVASAVARYERPEDVPQNERAAMIEAAEVDVDDAAANTGFNAVFTSYKIASVYK